jgi:hypothetical protein
MLSLTNRIHLSLPFIAIIVALACGLTPTPEPSPQPTPTPAQFAIGPTSASSGLSELKSYRSNLTVDFTGKRNGEVARGHIEALTEITRQPPARHDYFRIDGQIPQAKIPTGVSEFFQIGDQVYLKKAGDTLWSQFAAQNVSPAQVGFFELERLITLPATVSTPPITETLNGLSTQHYRFSETDLTDPHVVFEQTQGEVWIATPGRYVVQYALSTTLRVIIPPPQAHLLDHGQLTLRYALTDVDADFTVTPPANIPTNNTLSNLPHLPDAEIVSVFPSLVEYTSATSPISATQFYQDELAGLEWTEDTVAIFNEKSRLTFSKERQTLTIIITSVDDRQKIKVVLAIEVR